VERWNSGILEFCEQEADQDVITVFHHSITPSLHFPSDHSRGAQGDEIVVAQRQVAAIDLPGCARQSTGAVRVIPRATRLSLGTGPEVALVIVADDRMFHVDEKSRGLFLRAVHEFAPRC